MPSRGYQTRLLPSSSGANQKGQEGRLVSWKAAILFMATDFSNRLPASRVPPGSAPMNQYGASHMP